jgi:hypothetical protein
MKKIDKSERLVIERLIFPESFDVIQDETGLQYGELRDNLINLMNAGMVYAFDIDGEDSDSSPFVDIDNLQNFSFRATKQGLKAIQ